MAAASSSSMSLRPRPRSKDVLKITFWNTRNFSEKIFRKGKKGSTIEDKIREIADNIKLFNSNVVFLLEVGNDAKTIGEKIIARLNKTKEMYALMESPLTMSEKYLAIFEIDNKLAHIGMYGTIEGMRQGWLVEFSEKKILVCHAPFSKKAQNVIVDILSDIDNKTNLNPDIVCGDFNINDKGIPALKDKIGHYTYMGPYQSTSLRNPKTILNNPDDLFSEPYDQFWALDASGEAQSESISTSHKIKLELITKLTERLKTVILLLPGVSDRYNSKSSEDERVLGGNGYFQAHLKEIEAYNAYLNNNPDTVKNIGASDWFKWCATAIETLNGLKTVYVTPVGLNNKLSQMKDLMKVCAEMKGSVQLYEHDNAKEIVDIAVASDAITDHLPVSLEIPLK